MGKLSLADAQGLLEKGVLTKETYDKMSNDGLIAEGRQKRTPVVYKTQDGTMATLQIYWQGLSKSKPTLEMTTLKNELYKLALTRSNNDKHKKGTAKS